MIENKKINNGPVLIILGIYIVQVLQTCNIFRLCSWHVVFHLLWGNIET